MEDKGKKNEKKNEKKKKIVSCDFMLYLYWNHNSYLYKQI